MGHKVLVDGTEYEVSGGKALVGGTEYDVSKGVTLVDGTEWGVALDDRRFKVTAKVVTNYIANNENAEASFLGCVLLFNPGETVRDDFFNFSAPGLYTVKKHFGTILCVAIATMNYSSHISFRLNREEVYSGDGKSMPLLYYEIFSDIDIEMSLAAEMDEDGTLIRSDAEIHITGDLVETGPPETGES